MFSISLLLTGCYNGPDPQHFFGKSTKASLEFYIDGTSTLQVEETTDPATIRRWASFISKEKTPAYTCGYDGRIVFTKEQQTYDVNFNMADSCRHFMYIIDDALYTRKITDEGATYLNETMVKIIQTL